MSDLISREYLLNQYDLKNCTKYGNKSKNQQDHSYDTMMMYEIAYMIKDAPTEFDIDEVIKELEEQWLDCQKNMKSLCRIDISICVKRTKKHLTL